MTAPAFLLALSGMAGLVLSMDRHAGAAGLSDRATRLRWLRGGGWALLLASLLLRLMGGRADVGLVEWIGQAALAAAIVTVTRTYRPRLLRLLLPGAMLAAVIAGLL